MKARCGRRGHGELLPDEYLHVGVAHLLAADEVEDSTLEWSVCALSAIPILGDLLTHTRSAPSLRKAAGSRSLSVATAMAACLVEAGSRGLAGAAE
jgi:hypothetical protein